MTYGELKQTEMYLNAEDVELCVNDEEPVDEMYYPEELDCIQVVGIAFNGKIMQIDLVIPNWDNRYESDWVPSM